MTGNKQIRRGSESQTVKKERYQIPGTVSENVLSLTA